MKKLTTKCESFESDADEAGARAAADRMAKEFSSMTGARLRLDKDHDTVDSPMYGWTDSLEDLADDPDARYTFVYDVVGDLADQVLIRPTDRTVCVWRSVYDDYEGEGAVDPRTGLTEWCDWLDECSYPMSAWKNFNFDMIHGEEEYESLKRRGRFESRNSRRH